MMCYLKQMESIRVSGPPCDHEPTGQVRREDLGKRESVCPLRGSADGIY